ncbi:hexosaminidase [Pedobacter africanus]|uniref:Hexosaminidase n=1 Tax=Pedobacter africanus TaxID=151894 RepID=A0ACC6L1I4_9SPHI|nr:family 20 glycosylhydrolase [Pedobacter africanus]MDR6785227.1 hexosaminidase [Pedobacter africanus]
MNRLMTLWMAVFIVFNSTTKAQHPSRQLAIIPEPELVTVKPGSFGFNSATVILYDDRNTAMKFIGDQFSEKIKAYTGKKNPVKKITALPGKNQIVFKLSDQLQGISAEGYMMDIGSGGIVITAKQPQGCFYGMQTLLQLLPVNPLEGANVPALHIQDQPRFSWRGAMLDVSRHFFTVKQVKQYIDFLASYKLNTFHWHLTDNQGWRIEIKKYPLLTSVGAWRKRSLIGHFEEQPERFDTLPHGGFYTQEQIRDIIAYAQGKYITVVPEIDLPGHCTSALAGYPELGCGEKPGPFEVKDKWGVFDDVYCAGKENTFKFLEDVFTEVAALFPGKVIHIGGDECRKTNWKTCTYCQARMKKEGLKDEHELQGYFINRIAQVLKAKNKRVIGWDEILEGNRLTSDALVMSWRGTSGGVTAAKKHHDVVMTPTTYLYLDYYQGSPELEPLTIDGFNTLERVYNFEPIPAALNADEVKYIKGIQGNIWTEFIPDFHHLQYMAFPRLSALAEVAWSTPEKKNWEKFKQKMETEYSRYEASGINYSKSAYQVSFEFIKGARTQKAQIALKTQSYNPEIYYTLDGTEPGQHSTKYVGPFNVNPNVKVKAATFKNGVQMSKATEYELR